MKRFVLPVTTGLFVMVLAVPALVFFARSPVLAVTNASFAALYGADRARRQQVSASLALFRPVKTVLIADDASPDVQVITVSKAAAKPFCVLFPYIFAEAARRYHEEYPEISVVVLTGRAASSGLPSADGIFCVYGTDRDTDMYRAGLLTGIISDTVRKTAENASDGDETVKNMMNIVLFQDNSLKNDERELFSRGVREEDTESGVVFARTLAEMPDAGKISCAVFSGAGIEYLERNLQIPLVLFTWLDPALVPGEVTVIFDDSPRALTVPAVRMAAGKQAAGKIPSKPLILSGEFADNNVFKRLKKSAKKNP